MENRDSRPGFSVHRGEKLPQTQYPVSRQKTKGILGEILSPFSVVKGGKLCYNDYN